MTLSEAPTTTNPYALSKAPAETPSFRVALLRLKPFMVGEHGRLGIALASTIVSSTTGLLGAHDHRPRRRRIHPGPRLRWRTSLVDPPPGLVHRRSRRHVRADALDGQGGSLRPLQPAKRPVHQAAAAASGLLPSEQGRRPDLAHQQRYRQGESVLLAGARAVHSERLLHDRDSNLSRVAQPTAWARGAGARGHTASAHARHRCVGEKEERCQPSGAGGALARRFRKASATSV